MRKFRVVNCKQEKTTQTRKKFKSKDGSVETYVQYGNVQAGEDGWYPGAYGVEKIKEGDIIELDGHLADKCAKNPAFQEVFAEVKKPELVVKKKPKKKKSKAA